MRALALPHLALAAAGAVLATTSCGGSSPSTSRSTAAGVTTAAAVLGPPLQAGASPGATAGAPPAATYDGPRLRITSPDPTGWASDDRVTVRGQLTAGDASTTVRVLGRAVALAPDGSFTAQAGLVEGLNLISVEARDAAGGQDVEHLAILRGQARPEGDLLAKAATLRLTGAARAGASAWTASTAGGMPASRFIPAHASNYRRSGPRRIDRIVIHTIEGSEAGAISWFRNPRANVSAHYIVSHAGRVTRMLNDEDVGWHCRSWNGRAIGIENEGYAHRNTWTDTQLRTLAQLVRALCDRHNIPKDRAHIVGHVEVPGNTHTDPGPYFDWAKFMRLVNPPPRPTSATATLKSPLGHEVEVRWSAGRPGSDGSGVSVPFDLMARAPKPVPAPAGAPSAALSGWWSVGGRAPGLARTAGSGWDAALALHQDGLNQVLHAAWRAGALSVRLDAATAARLLPGAPPVELACDAYRQSDPDLAALLPAGALLELELALALPPIARLGTTQAGAGWAELGLGALSVEVFARDPAAGAAAQPVASFTAHLRASLDLAGSADDPRLVVRGARDLRLDAEDGDAATRSRTRRLAAAVLTETLDAYLAALRGLFPPLPPRGANLTGPVGAGVNGRSLLVAGRAP